MVNFTEPEEKENFYWMFSEPVIKPSTAVSRISIAS